MCVSFSFRLVRSRESLIWTTQAGLIMEPRLNQTNSWHSFPSWDTSTNQAPSSLTAVQGLADQERSFASMWFLASSAKMQM